MAYFAANVSVNMGNLAEIATWVAPAHAGVASTTSASYGDATHGVLFEGHFQLASGKVTGGILESVDVIYQAVRQYVLDGFTYDVNAFIANAQAGKVPLSLTGILAGADTIVGSNFGDVLVGFAGKDSIDGRAGADTIDGGRGHDLLVGGVDQDTFVFSFAAAKNADRVMDFSSTDDTIALSKAAFKSLHGTHLAARFFHVGTAAHDANDHVIYNDHTGALAYDPDGTGVLPAIKFAVLAGHPTLTAGDFLLI